MLQLILSFILATGSCSAQQSCGPMMDYICENLSCCGTLKQSNGFVYIDIDDGYIHDLFPFVRQEGFQEPPYFGCADLVGAHITVIYPYEMEKYHVGHIEECGMRVCFTPVACYILNPPHWKGVESVYLISVDVPELKGFRKKYGLPKPMFDYHITVGIKCSDSGNGSIL